MYRDETWILQHYFLGVHRRKTIGVCNLHSRYVVRGRSVDHEHQRQVTTAKEANVLVQNWTCFILILWDSKTVLREQDTDNNSLPLETHNLLLGLPYYWYLMDEFLSHTLQMAFYSMNQGHCLFAHLSVAMTCHSSYLLQCHHSICSELYQMKQGKSLTLAN